MAWYNDMVKEFKDPEIPEDSMTSNEFARRIGKGKRQARETLLGKFNDGELKRVWSGGEFHYYA